MLGLYTGVYVLGGGRGPGMMASMMTFGWILSLYTLEIENSPNSSAYTRLQCEPRPPSLRNVRPSKVAGPRMTFSARARSNPPHNLNWPRHGAASLERPPALKPPAKDDRFIQRAGFKESQLPRWAVSAGMRIPEGARILPPDDFRYFDSESEGCHDSSFRFDGVSGSPRTSLRAPCACGR